MGISLSFYKKNKLNGVSTHMSYSTAMIIFELAGLRQESERINKDYFVDINAKKVVKHFEKFLAEQNNRNKKGFKSSFLIPSFKEKEVLFVKQILNDYRILRQMGVKPDRFGGA